MLSLEPPILEIDGLTVFRDHAIADQFYYLAPHPQIARVDGRIMFDLFAYTVELKHSPLAGTAIPEELGAGFLNMGVSCALTDAQRERLRSSIATRMDRDPDKVVALPAPYHKGSVRVLALDKFSAPGQAAGSPASEDRLKGRPTFVEEILGEATPGLFGDLRSIFSLRLSQNGVAFLEALYKDGAAPVGVVYDLKFYGMRPSIEVVVKADLARIYKHFGGGLEGQYQWFKADISAGVDYLKEQSAIDIQVTSHAVGDAAEKSKELALSLFKDRIIQDLFRPTAPQVPNNLSSIASTAATTAAGGATTAANSKGSIGFTLKFQKNEDLKVLEYKFSERAPEERTHSPQAFVALLASKPEIEKRIHRVDLANDFFETLDVLVTGPTKEEFDSLRIRQVEATITYGEPGDASPPESRSLLFRADSTGDKVFSVKRRGRKTLAYKYSLVYDFVADPNLDAESQRLDFPNRTATSRTLLINPTNDFGVLKLEVESGRIDESIRQVDVTLQYKSRLSQFKAEQRFRINRMPNAPAGQPMRWQVRTRERDLAPYQAINTFVFDEGAQYTAPVVNSTEPLFRVDSPFQHVRRLLVKPNVVSPNITQLTVEVEYQDKVGGYSRKLFTSLVPPFESKEITWPILDPNHQKIRYRATTHEPGFISEGDWQETDSASIIVGAVGSRVAVVNVRLIGATLTDVNLDALMVKLQLALASTDSADPVSLFFEPAGPTAQDARLTVPPAFTFRYRYQTTAFKRTGEVVESAWKEDTNRLLVISTRNI
ncbi:MAG: hypothetical protein IT168_19680 [Bryobacterales bacterium]|nr:hypothetical protein [Bryobacterales bacterium]